MIQVIGMDRAESWDRIVKSFADYDVYYLCGYLKAFRVHGDGEPLLFYFENGATRAMNAVMRRDIGRAPKLAGLIPENTYFDLSTPYGYGGFLVEGEDVADLDREYSQYCRDRGIISEFVRFHPVLGNAGPVAPMYGTAVRGRTITMELSSPEQIWNDLAAKNRNIIRKAQKSGVEVCWGRDRSLFSEFMRLYGRTMDRDHADPYYYFEKEFYDSIFEDLRHHSLVFYSLYTGKIIAMAVILFANGRMHYHLSASDREYGHLAPTNLLLYEAACWGCENGLRTLHLGGGLGGREDSLFRFKAAFREKSDTFFSTGTKVFDEKICRELIGIRNLESAGEPEADTSFFPAYRR